jgi:hypothetical protein
MRHNKKRNPALLYEFLVRHVAKCLVHNKQDEAKKALDLSKKYFAKGQPLHEELSLFKSVLETEVRSRNSAQKLIDAACELAKKVSVRELDTAKSKIIKEINYTFKDEQFYNYKIPGYTVYASIQTLLNESRNKKKALTETQKIQLEDVIAEYVVTAEEDMQDHLKANPAYNSTVYNLVVEKFHEKYEQKLSDRQKRLLTSYASAMISDDFSKIKEAVEEESKDIKKTLRAIGDKQIREDQSLMQKLHECYKGFVSLDLTTVSDDTILEVLRYMQLVDEVKS